MFRVGDIVELKRDVVERKFNKWEDRFENITKIKNGEKRTIVRSYCNFHNNYTLWISLRLSGECVSFTETVATTKDLEKFPFEVIEKVREKVFSAGDWITFTGDNQIINHVFQYRPWITPLYLLSKNEKNISGYWPQIFQFQEECWVPVNFKASNGKKYYVVEADGQSFKIKVEKDDEKSIDVELFHPYICNTNKEKVSKFFGLDNYDYWSLGGNWQEEIDCQREIVSQTGLICPFELSRTVDLQNIAAEPFAAK